MSKGTKIMIVSTAMFGLAIIAFPQFYKLIGGALLLLAGYTLLKEGWK